MKPLLLSALLLAAVPSLAVEFDASVATGLTLARAAAEHAEDVKALIAENLARRKPAKP
ncbi:MAG: hypothetical protein Q7J64_03175 [Elusimicrobiota bacterium]|nr:hypothetical protein [Elusimicrobiota bacterium]